MADVITRFRLETTQYDSALRNESQRLAEFAKKATAAGNEFGKFTQKNAEAARAMGQIGTSATNSKDKVKELVGSFNDLAKAYNQLTKEQQQSDFGKAMAESLQTLKGRITEAKQELYGLDAAASDTGVAGTDLTSVLQGLGNQFGINSNLMGALTSGTIATTAAITAGAGAVAAATKMWIEYNDELNRQTNVTSVTTGLKGDDATELTLGVRALAKTYNVDFREAINTANSLIQQFGLNGEQALSLLKDGMQGMIAGDGPKLLNMIQQFAPAFRDAGISADQLVAVIHNSEGGLFSDQNMNAILMGIKNIRLMTSATSAALAKMGIDGEEMTKKMNDGSMTVFEALRQVSEAIEGANASSQEAGEVMQQVFGRQGAMQGMKLGRAIATLNLNLEETKTQTGEIGESFDRLNQANTRLENAMRDLFGMTGWEDMNNMLKTDLANTFADLLNDVNGLKESISGLDGSAESFINLGNSIDKFLLPGVGEAIRRIGQLKGIIDSLTGNGPKTPSKSISERMDEMRRIIDEQIQKNQPPKSTYTVTKKNGKVVSATRTENGVTVDDTANYVENQKQKQQAPTTNPPKPTTTPTVKQTPETKAADIVKSAQEAYAQTMVEARLSLEAGMDDTLAYKKKELDAQQRMFEAYGKAYAVYASPEYKDAYDQATDQYKRMAAELAKSTEEQKIVTENAKALEAAQKKLAEEERKVAEAAAAGKYISKRAVNNARKEVERLTQIVDVKAGKVELPDIPKEVTVKVSADAKALEDAKKTLADAQQKLKEAEATGNQQNIYVSKRAVNNARKEVERLTQIVDVKAGKVELPDIPKEVEQVVNTKVGEVLTPEIAAEIVQTISTQLGDIITPEIADQLTQTINTKVGEVITPDIATELTQVVNVVTGDVELPDIPKEVEQVVNTKVGEVLTPDIAAEIVQTISTQLGDIITPEIADQLTQTINTKVGEVVTPDIATELTQVVNVVTGDVDLPDIPKEKEVKVKFTQENLQALTSDLKMQQQQAVVGSMDYTKITEQIADANALKNVMQTALQEGLDNVVIDSQKLFDQLLNADNIPDSVWDNIIEQMNAGMKEGKSGKQYEFNAQTGDVKETKTATTNESVVGLMQKTAGGIGSIVSGVEGLGAEIPEGFKDVIGGINSAMTIMQGIASILAIIETLNEAQSIGSFIPFFKNGGKVPHAATGLVVPGNDHSDHTLIAASSGEVILNRAQQSNLINDLDGAGRNVTVRGVIDGTTIRLVLDNTSRQMGKGTYVTSR